MTVIAEPPSPLLPTVVGSFKKVKTEEGCDDDVVDLKTCYITVHADVASV